MCTTKLSQYKEALSQSHVIITVFKLLCAQCFPDRNFEKTYLPKTKWGGKQQG
jgi:hypothetical protein